MMNMTLPIVLALVGSIALLAGLFGGGIKAKEIEVPKISILARIVSSFVGIILIVIAIRLPTQDSLPDPIQISSTLPAQPSATTAIPPTEFPPTQFPATPIPTNTSIPTSTATATQTPTHTPSSTPTLPPVTVEVYAIQSWQASGVSVKSSDSVQITYITGQWRVRPDFEFTDPLGSYPGDDLITDPECHFPMLPSVAGDQALIAKIGENGEPFNPFKRIRVAEGMLYLRVNDCDKYLYDNSGSVTVRIQLIP